MSASTLREAAAKLRGLAEGASDWNFTDGRLSVVDYDPSDPTGQTAMQVVVGVADEPWAAYIAAMSPPVALALADWLDATAAWYAADSRGVPVSDLETFESDWFFEDPALAVAEAVLGPRA